MDKIQEVKQKLNSYRGNKFLVGEDIHETAIDALNVITEQEREIDRLNCKIRQLYERISEIEETKKRAIETSNEETRRAKRAVIRQTAINEKLHRCISVTNENAFRIAAKNKELSERLKDTEGLRVTMATVAEDRKIENARLRDELTAAKNEASINYDRYVSAANEVGRAKKALEDEQEKCADAETKLDEKKAELANTKKELGNCRDKLIEMTTKASSFVIEPDEVDVIHLRKCPECNNEFRFFIKRAVPVEVTGESPRKYANCPRCKEPINDHDNKFACGHCGTPLDWGNKIDEERNT